mgnify:FL=1
MQLVLQVTCFIFVTLCFVIPQWVGSSCIPIYHLKVLILYYEEVKEISFCEMITYYLFRGFEFFSR